MNQPVSEPKSGNAFAKYFFMLILGGVIGAFGAVYALNALHSNPEAKFRDGMMSTFGWNMGQLKKNVAEAKCTPTDTIPRIQAINVMARDLEAAFPKLADEPEFVKQATNLRTASNNALMAPPQTCDGVSEAMRNMGMACESCHKSYKD